jgi:hypothetical protein
MHQSGGRQLLTDPPLQALPQRVLLRKMQSVLGPQVWEASRHSTPIEVFTAADAPTIAPAKPIEESTHARRIESNGITEVSAFLDGIQRTSIITHVDSVPIIQGFVAAVIRIRRERRMSTWNAPRSMRALYLPRAVTGDVLWRALQEQGLTLFDTSGDDASAHPLQMRRRAVDRVAIERERLEQTLASDWHASEEGWLWVDGGVSGIPSLVVGSLAETSVFGVVKSHATLYGDQSMLAATLRLGEAERSPAFVIRHRVRSTVISWYLRLRCSADLDPMHGLVRVELLAPEMSVSDEDSMATTSLSEEITTLADNISAWILAERMPLSLPDSRWDRLTYGVRDCERYLDALAGTH